MQWSAGDSLRCCTHRQATTSCDYDQRNELRRVDTAVRLGAADRRHRPRCKTRMLARPALRVDLLDGSASRQPLLVESLSALRWGAPGRNGGAGGLPQPLTAIPIPKCRRVTRSEGSPSNRSRGRAAVALPARRRVPNHVTGAPRPARYWHNRPGVTTSTAPSQASKRRTWSRFGPSSGSPASSNGPLNCPASGSGYAQGRSTRCTGRNERGSRALPRVRALAAEQTPDRCSSSGPRPISSSAGRHHVRGLRRRRREGPNG